MWSRKVNTVDLFHILKLYTLASTCQAIRTHAAHMRHGADTYSSVLLWYTYHYSFVK